jgi:predicted  nucleic acid-binding Zn-ribbon protein
MGLFGKRASDNAQVELLRAELAALRDRVDASDRAKADLEATVDELNHRLIATVTSTPEIPPVDEPPPTPAGPDTDELNRQLASLDERLANLDGRVTAVSTELANQVNELGNDIEPMQVAAERLAAEQARYQIAFRQDLAELAERIRRPGNT